MIKIKLYKHQSDALEATQDKNRDTKFKCGKAHINYKHGMCKSRIYKTWEGMKNRCYCKGQTSYKWYGGKGVTVCDEWSHDFQAFYDWAINNGYEDNLTLDRIYNNKGYEPSNCRWVTMKEQTRNRSSNRFLTYKGKTQCIVDWANEIGIDRRTITKRIDKLGWTVEKALSTPLQKKGGGDLIDKTIRSSKTSVECN